VVCHPIRHTHDCEAGWGRRLDGISSSVSKNFYGRRHLLVRRSQRLACTSRLRPGRWVKSISLAGTSARPWKNDLQ
jgi:hypothetical protein